MSIASTATLASLRQQIEGIERIHTRAKSVLPFAVPEIDAKLPGGGLALGALHEIAGGAADAVDGAASVAFAAGIAARTGGTVLWCHYSDDLFEPALARFGLTTDRVIFFRAKDERDLLSGFEEALRHGGLTAVVGEMAGLSHLSSQRLQLAAEQTGTMALAVRRWRRHVDARDYGLPTTSFTRWRVTEARSAPLPVRGVGRARWHLELMRCRAGSGADFDVEACNAKGFITLPALLADRSAEADYGNYRAVS